MSRAANNLSFFIALYYKTNVICCFPGLLEIILCSTFILPSYSVQILSVKTANSPLSSPIYSIIFSFDFLLYNHIYICNNIDYICTRSAVSKHICNIQDDQTVTSPTLVPEVTSWTLSHPFWWRLQNVTQIPNSSPCLE